jgi:hypothetical protein
MSIAIAALLLGLTKPPGALCTFFVIKDCPIANRYAPEIKRIIRDYTPKGVQFVLELEDQDVTAQDASAHAREFGFTVPIKVDREHKDARQWKVDISPTAVLSLGSQLIYRGRIDNSYAGVGKPRTVTTSHDLRNALDAFLIGKKIPLQDTTAIGCRIF